MKTNVNLYKVIVNEELFKSAANNVDMSSIHCPSCGCENAHIDGMFLLAPTDRYSGRLTKVKTTGEAITLDEPLIETPYRGVHVGIEMSCEGNGVITGMNDDETYEVCTWIRYMAFHKGHCYTWDQISDPKKGSVGPA